jgi:predicted enzyme related to lactoylglutathione lyase
MRLFHVEQKGIMIKNKQCGTDEHQKQIKMKRVTGIGGVFFKVKDKGKTREWYKNHLGINSEDWGSTFEWREKEDPSKEGSTAWSPFKDSSDYFEPSKKEFMINYRVENMEALLIELKKEGITIIGEQAQEGYGKFAWIMDPDGNKIELWEPAGK